MSHSVFVQSSGTAHKMLHIGIMQYLHCGQRASFEIGHKRIHGTHQPNRADHSRVRSIQSAREGRRTDTPSGRAHGDRRLDWIIEINKLHSSLNGHYVVNTNIPAIPRQHRRGPPQPPTAVTLRARTPLTRGNADSTGMSGAFRITNMVCI